MKTIHINDLSDTNATVHEDEAADVKGGPHIVTLDGLGYDFQGLGGTSASIQPTTFRR